MSEKPLSTPLLHTPSPAAHKLELLRQLFPQAVQTDPDGSVRVDAAQIQRALDPANAQGIRVEETGYELRWVGKQEAYHTAFARTDKIVAPVPADSKAWDSTGNLLMKGDNLDALKLLRQSYFGQVKLIYIDPPYNTKSDEFIYRDDFTARQTDILAQLGYSADNVEYIQNIYGARTHSGWLSFMYPRLLLAKDLLRDDGVIFISIDDNEQAQLKMLCDEVFGQDAFAGKFPWRKRTAKSDVPYGISQDYEWILCYSKSEFMAGHEHERAYYTTPDFPNDRWRTSDLTKQTKASDRENSAFDMVNPKTGDVYPFNPRRSWSITKETFPEYYKKKKIVFPGDYDFLQIKSPVFRVFESEDKAKSIAKHGTEEAIKALSTQLPEKLVGRSEHGNKDFESLFGAAFFPFPKPVGLVQFLLSACLSEEDTALDFFAGSGTTGEAVMRLNAEDGGQRQFILVQIPQPIDPKKQKEAHSFVTQTLGKPEATIFEITAERLRRAGDKINAAQRSQGKPEVDAGFRVYALADDPHALVHRTRLDEATQADVAALQTAIATPQPEQRPVVLANLLLTEGLPLSATLTPLAAGSVADALWQAQDTLLVLDAVPLDALVDLLRQRKAAGTPVHHVSVYAPWVHDDNFLQGVQTLLEAEGFSADRLRLRG